MPLKAQDLRKGQKPKAPLDAKVVWTRPDTRRRAPPTREAIVNVAVSLADDKGLDAVSIRQIATRFDIRPMSVYRYAGIESKEELFELMIDTVCAEMLLTKDRRKGWRKTLREISIRSRSVLILHPWWIELVGRRVLIGPNAMRYREQSLATVADLQVAQERKMAIVTALEAYTVGHASLAIDRSGSLRKADPGFEAWRKDIESYQRSLIATGDFPNIAELGTTGTPSPEDLEGMFLFGLDCLLGGIADFLATANLAAKEG